MDLAKFREYCLSKPQTTEGTPFSPMFSFSGALLVDF